MQSSAEVLVLRTLRTQRITGSAFRISFHPDWQIDNAMAFFNRPIIAPTQGFRRRYFVDGLNQSFKFRLWRRLNWVEPAFAFTLCFFMFEQKKILTVVVSRCESPIKGEKTYCMLVFISLASSRVPGHIRDFSLLSRALNLKPHLQKYIDSFDMLKF